jgi:hypothetical protein
MSSKLRNLLLIAGVIGFIICYLLYIYYPAFPRSFLGWLVIIFIGIPVWLFLEWIGERMFGMQFFNKLSSPMRVIIAIPFFIALVAVAAFLVQLVQKLMSIT